MAKYLRCENIEAGCGRVGLGSHWLGAVEQTTARLRNRRETSAVVDLCGEVRSVMAGIGGSGRGKGLFSHSEAQREHGIRQFAS